MQLILLAALRNGLKLAGMAGLYSDSQLQEATGALMLIGGLVWTGVNVWRERWAKAIECD